MGTKMVSLRVDEELLGWATGYAAEREVSRSELLESALVSFREDCDRGVPELRAAAARQSSVPSKTGGVGKCPFHGGGHVFAPASQDPMRHCGCGLAGRGERGEESFLQTATSERALLFARLRAPESAHGRAKKS